MTARLFKDGQLAGETTLKFADIVSTYSGTLTLPEAGSYRLEILAADPKQANLGRVERELTVSP